MNLSLGNYNDMTKTADAVSRRLGQTTPDPSGRSSLQKSGLGKTGLGEDDSEKRAGLRKTGLGEDDSEKRAGLRKPQSECETCKRRKYKDGSDEMVSFKSAAHISPESAAARVRAHEQEHVSNAYKKAAAGEGKVIAASVSLRMAICPECGRSYVSGGTTHTQIKYYNEDNPYQQGLKTADRARYSGMNVNYRA